MISVTRWTPDSCECVIEFQYDDTIIPHDYVLHQIISKCVIHSPLPDVDVFNSVFRENRLKNAILAASINQISTISQTMPTEPSEKMLKPNIKFEYELIGSDPANRTVKISFFDDNTKTDVILTKSDTTKIQTELKNKFDIDIDTVITK